MGHVELNKNFLDSISEDDFQKIERFNESMKLVNESIKKGISGDNFKKIKEFLDLIDEDAILKIERFNKSIRDRELAEAQKESAQWKRFLFQRTAKKYLPVVIYMMYMGGLLIYALVKILSLDTSKMIIGLVFLLITMVPMFLLSKEKKSEDNIIPEHER